MLFWRNQLVMLCGNVASNDTKATDVCLLDLDELHVKLWRFQEGLAENPENEDLSPYGYTETFAHQTELPRVSRRLHSATYIGEDRVLIVGGIAIQAAPSLMDTVASPRSTSVDFGIQQHDETDSDNLFHPNTILKDAWILDLQQKTWTSVAPAPEYLHGHSAVYDPEAQCVYVFGGSNHANEKLNALYVYYVHKNMWKKLDGLKGAIPTPREQHAACFHPLNRQMIIYGGWTAAGPRSDCFAYDVDQMTFYRVGVSEEMDRTPRYGHVAECFGSRVIVHGGRDDYFQNLDTFEVIQVWDDEDDFSGYVESELESKLKQITPSHVFFGEEAKKEYFEANRSDADEDALMGKPRLTRINTSTVDGGSFDESRKSLSPSGMDPVTGASVDDTNSDDSPKYASPRLGSPSPRFASPSQRSLDPERGEDDSIYESLSPAQRRQSTDPEDHFADLLESIVNEKERENTPQRAGIPPIDPASRQVRRQASTGALSARSSDSAKTRKSVSFSSDHDVKFIEKR